MISRRTAASDSVGQRATRVGTVETTVTSLATSQGPTSMPLRTSERGAGTRQPPCAQASHISSHDASKATERPAITRSCGPSGASCRNMRDSASTNAAAERCETATPFGLPVEPDVKMTQASSSGSGRLGLARHAAGSTGCDGQVVADQHRDVGLVEDQPGPLVRVVGIDRHVGGTREQDADDGDVELQRAGPDPDTDAVAAADAVALQRRGELVGGLLELAVRHHVGAVVQCGALGVLHRDRMEDVDQRARGRRRRGTLQRRVGARHQIRGNNRPGRSPVSKTLAAEPTICGSARPMSSWSLSV